MHSFFHGKSMAQKAIALSATTLRDHDSLPSPLRKAGQPRLNPFSAMLYDFYEPLVLLALLQRVLGLHKHALLDSTLSGHLSAWGNFLSQLSWLCDYKNGGDTSSSIAVEATIIGPKYWLAMNYDSQQRGPEHLRIVLQRLSTLITSRADTHKAICNEILELCLHFSTKKFENYRCLLLKNLKVARGSPGDIPDSPG